MNANASITEKSERKSCVQECEDKGSILGGQLVYQRAKKQISVAEYDKLAKKSHNEDLKCIKACKMGHRAKKNSN